MNCTNCNALLETNAKFCGECGHPVSSEPLPSGPLSPAPTLLEEGPPPPLAKPPIEITPSPAKRPAPVPPPPPQISPVAQPPPVPPPAAGAQQPAFQQAAVEPPKKGRSGCTIVIILLAVVAICCVGSLAVSWYVLNNAEFDFSSSGFDIPFLEQFQEGDLPFLDQFLGEGTPDEFFDDFFSSQTNLTLQNASDLTVCSLYITPTESQDWGYDWLDEDEFIFPGDTRTFQLEPNQFVDISAEDCEEFLIYEQYEIDLSSEDVVITLELAP